MPKTPLSWLSVKDGRIVSDEGSVMLRGVNFGGWLMMEGYILHSPNRAVRLFEQDFARRLGDAALAEFHAAFRDNFIRDDDMRRVQEMGFNCVRLPFHSRLVEGGNGLDPEGVAYIDRAVRWARQHGVWLILDMHAACGAQNHDWHSDSLGPAELWDNPRLQQRTMRLWAQLAERYGDEPAVAGYDLLNEAVVGDISKLNAYYEALIREIRTVDRRHICFVEGNRWAMDLDGLTELDDPQLALSVHCYEPLEFVFQFIPGIRYPIRGPEGGFDRHAIHKRLAAYRDYAQKRQRPLLLGEFGVNVRDGRDGEELWLADMLAELNDLGIHWTYWTYKAVKNEAFPDGIFSYCANPAWVNRQGPLAGWETYADCWPQHRADMAQSWRTEHFRENAGVSNVLQKAAAV